MYKHIKTSPKEIIKSCNELEKEYYNYDYYNIRYRFNGIYRKNNKLEKYKGIERSSALILLNKTGFNGMYRVNRQGLFNIPKGRYKKPLIVDEENLFKLSSLLPKLENIRKLEEYLGTKIKKENECDNISLKGKLKEYVNSHIDVKKRIENLYSIDMMIWNSF